MKKELTRTRDALAAQRRRKPRMAEEKEYASRARTARRACSTCSRGAAPVRRGGELGLSGVARARDVALHEQAEAVRLSKS